MMTKDGTLPASFLPNPNWKDEIHISLVKPPDEGGQRVGSPNYPVRVVHLPTGVTAECGYERSQHKNKQIAMDMVQWALVNMNFSSEYCK